MAANQLVLGIDFGTDSVRALIVDAATGESLGSSVAEYKRWSKGLYCDPARNQFRQHPLDYVEGLESSVQGALESIPDHSGDKIAGIGIDTTGSTPCIIDERGMPLAMQDEFAENPNAMFILWKDHTAIEEAEIINRTARSWGGVDVTKYSGGSYSSEWFWSQLLHVLRHDSQIREAAYSCVEHCDWMPALLTGVQDPHRMARSRCAAGHKAMWHAEWDGLPDEAFWKQVDPVLKGFRSRIVDRTMTCDHAAGKLADVWAERLGLRSGIPVAVGGIDAHFGAVGGGIRTGILSKIIGTSTCDMMVVPNEVLGDRLIKGISGQVDGSIIPGAVGLEAGQSAFGDVYAWFREFLTWPVMQMLPRLGTEERHCRDLESNLHDHLLSVLAEEAEKIPPEQTGLIALDWLNGRRNPDADYALKGAIAGLNLGTTPPRVYRALVEATAFGAKSIADRFIDYSIEIKKVVAMGGIPQKSPFVMQILADVMGMPIEVSAAEQATALGAAMFGAVAAGLFSTVEQAQDKLGQGFSRTYTPDAKNMAGYENMYQRYHAMGLKLEDLLKQL